MEVAQINKQMDTEAGKAVDFAIHEFNSVNTGKASPSMVEHLQVEAYGSMMQLKEMAAINTPDMRTIVIQPWDKSMLKPIEKAIQAANLGMNPVIQGEIIRLPMPDLTGDRRQEMVKVVSRFAEEARVGVRKARQHAMDALKKSQKDGVISEDELKRGEKDIQSKTDASIKKINDLLAQKEKDLLKV